MLLQALKNEKFTENGALCYDSTFNYLLDFFAMGGSCRNRSDEDIIELFMKAYNQDRIKAIQLLFYFRDVRGGQGERRLFRVILNHLASIDNGIEKLIPIIEEYGRYDDLYCLVGTRFESQMFSYLHTKFLEDLESEYPSLLGKWLKSENTSSKESRKLGRLTRKAFNMSPKDYRKALSKLREKIDIVERKMSNNEWSEIDYSKLPSRAGLLYSQAFMNNDYSRYHEFMCPDIDCCVKLNASALYPYEIVKDVPEYGSVDELKRSVLNNYWANIPDYLNGESSNSLAVIDVSGSMTGTPMEVAVSLGLYMAERNTGEFHNHFITFSSLPKLIEIKDKWDFVDRVRHIKSSDWGYNTDIEKVFLLLLNKAKKFNLSQDDMPKLVYIISDMEFDVATVGSNSDTVFEGLAKVFKENGFELPHLVFWNVDSRQNNIPVIGVGHYSLVSGFSPVIFETVMKQLSAEEVMNEVLNKERYMKLYELLSE